MACASLILLLCWPLILVVGTILFLFGFAVEVLAILLTSPAFPAFLVTMGLGVWGTIETALVFWRRYKDPESDPLTLKKFKKTFILYGLSFVAACVCLYLAVMALHGYIVSGGSDTSTATTAAAAAALISHVLA